MTRHARAIGEPAQKHLAVLESMRPIGIKRMSRKNGETQRNKYQNKHYFRPARGSGGPEKPAATCKDDALPMCSAYTGRIGYPQLTGTPFETSVDNF